MNRLAHGLVATEAKRHVGHTTADLGPRQVLFNPTGGFNKVNRVVVVLLNTSSNSKDIGVKNNVFRWEIYLIHQDTVSALANLDFARKGVGLTGFIKRHHHGGSAITLDQLGLALELFHPLFHADRVHYGLALNATQTCLDYLPLGAIHHNGHTGNIGLTRNQIDKAHHGSLAVQHGLIHVDIDDLRAILHLLACHRQSIFVLLVQNHAGKRLGACHVGAFTHVDEQTVVING